MNEQGWVPAYPGIKYNWSEEAVSFDCSCGARDIVISESGESVTCACGRVYRLQHYVECGAIMNETERLIYKDRVQSIALAALQNATVQANADENGVTLIVIFEGLGETVIYVPWEDNLLPLFVGRELQQRLYLLSKEKYFR